MFESDAVTKPTYCIVKGKQLLYKVYVFILYWYIYVFIYRVCSYESELRFDWNACICFFTLTAQIHCCILILPLNWDLIDGLICRKTCGLLENCWQKCLSCCWPAAQLFKYQDHVFLIKSSKTLKTHEKIHAKLVWLFIFVKVSRFSTLLTKCFCGNEQICLTWTLIFISYLQDETFLHVTLVNVFLFVQQIISEWNRK